MSARVLGRTGLSVQPIGFGSWAIGGNRFGNSYGPTDDAEGKRAVRRAHELGCTFFDTADVYGHGHSEELLGDALAGIRQDVVLATKVGGNFYNRDVNPLLLGRIADALGHPSTRSRPMYRCRSPMTPPSLPRTCGSPSNAPCVGCAPTTSTCCSSTTPPSP